MDEDRGRQIHGHRDQQLHHGDTGTDRSRTRRIRQDRQSGRKAHQHEPPDQIDRQKPAQPDARMPSDQQHGLPKSAQPPKNALVMNRMLKSLCSKSTPTVAARAEAAIPVRAGNLDRALVTP